MKYHPYIVTTEEALLKALVNDASVILVDGSLLPGCMEALNRYEYLPMDLPARTGKLFCHPDAEDPEVVDPKGIL